MLRHRLILAGALFCAACGARAGDAEMSAAPISCELSGPDQAGADPQQVCDLFTDAAAKAGRSDIAKIDIIVSAPTTARAVARDRSGSELMALDFDVMDTGLSMSAWRIFARSFADQLVAK